MEPKEEAKQTNTSQVGLRVLDEDANKGICEDAGSSEVPTKRRTIISTVMLFVIAITTAGIIGGILFSSKGKGINNTMNSN